MTDQLISVVLPVHNQADHVGLIVEGYEAALSGIQYPHETVLVVNGSTDDSLSICQALAERYPSIRVLHSQQGAWGLAVKLGLSRARGEILCYTNSARTSPQELVLTIQHAVSHPETAVKANRGLRDSIVRQAGSLLYNIECRILFGLHTWDLNGTPKVFPRKFNRLLTLTRDDDLIDLEFNVICRREGYPLIEVPIVSTQRHGGKSTTRLRSAVKMYRGAFEMWRSMNRDQW